MPARHFTHDVFLSHKGAQKDWTENLARRLRDDGFKVWFDKWVLPQHAGRNWIDELREGVESSRKTILVFSPEFLAGDWPTFESTIIQLIDPVGRLDRIIPLLHTPCEIPKHWAFRQTLDFTNAPIGTEEFEFHYHHIVHNLDNSRPYEGDFERFKKRKTSKVDPKTIPPVRPLPPGSRMPQASNPLFVGREDEMRDLARMLTPGSGALVGVHAAVIGMGGVGKTQLAVEYAHRYGHLYQGGVFWLSFAGEEDPINEVARCGGPEGLDIAGWNEMKAPEQASRVHKAWEEDERASLVIFDNAEDPASVDKWRPKSGHCSVLITCRRGDWPPEIGVNPLGIETLQREKSLELLAEVRSSINSNAQDHEAADKICDLLGDLPLALTVAAAYLRKYKSESVGQYLKALSDQSPIADASLEKVALSFGVSFNKLNPANPTDALAQKLFYLASWFAPVSINRDLLIASAGFDSSDRQARHHADDALARLMELGLIKEEADKERGDSRLLLHRLLRDFARVQEHGFLGKSSRATVLHRLLDGLIPRKRPRKPGIQEAIEAVGASLTRFGKKELESGLPQAMGRERAHFREIAIGAAQCNPYLASRLYSDLGLNGNELALFHEAKVDHEKALKIVETVYGQNQPEVATDLNNLGSVLNNMGDLAGARTCFERALTIIERAYGPRDPVIAITMNNLALVLRALGDLTGARAYLDRALKIDEAAYPGNVPRLAIRLNNLGLVLHDLGDLAEARACFERALTIDEAVHGSSHPYIAIDINNLGRVLQVSGDLDRARACFERALKIDEAVYGPVHPAVAKDVNNLGGVLKDLGDLAAARANGERALKILKKFLGDDHPNTRLAQRNLDALAITENQQKKSL